MPLSDALAMPWGQPERSAPPAVATAPAGPKAEPSPQAQPQSPPLPSEQAGPPPVAPEPLIVPVAAPFAVEVPGTPPDPAIFEPVGPPSVYRDVRPVRVMPRRTTLYIGCDANGRWCYSHDRARLYHVTAELPIDVRVDDNDEIQVTTPEG